MTELSFPAELQATMYATNCVIAAMLSRLLEKEDDIDAATLDILDTTMGSIAKFEMRGDNTETQRMTARAMMEAQATALITASSRSAHLRRNRR